MITAKFPKNPDGSELTEEQRDEKLEELLKALEERGLIGTIIKFPEGADFNEVFERGKAEHERRVLEKAQGKTKDDLN